MQTRVLEPELMDTGEDAREYDAMDHAAVNAQFVADLLELLNAEQPLQILDLGAGTAQIPIELARRAPGVHVTAVDAAASMLALARKNVEAAGLTGRIGLVFADAKQLPFATDSFSVVISNSIVHHIAEPRSVVAELIRVAAPDGLLFHRDLARPRDEAELEHLVHTYAAGTTPRQRQLFADSLRAALTLEETREIIANFGYPPGSVCMTSDRHWTWTATKRIAPV